MITRNYAVVLPFRGNRGDIIPILCWRVGCCFLPLFYRLKSEQVDPQLSPPWHGAWCSVDGTYFLFGGTRTLNTWKSTASAAEIKRYYIPRNLGGAACKVGLRGPISQR